MCRFERNEVRAPSKHEEGNLTSLFYPSVFNYTAYGNYLDPVV